MKKLLEASGWMIILPLLLLCSIAQAQNPITDTTKYLTGNCLKPDTMIKTLVVTGKSGYFSSTVRLSTSKSFLLHPYKTPVAPPPPPPPVDTTVVTPPPPPPPPPGTRTGIEQELTFDGTTFPFNDKITASKGPFWWDTQSPAATSVTSTSDSYKGSGAMLVKLNLTDGKTSSSYRSEIQQSQEETNTVSEHWFGFAVKPLSLTGNDASIFQTHHRNSVSIPPLAIWLSNGSLSVVHTKEGQGVNNIYDDLGALSNNVWHTIVIHCKFSPGSDGILEVWVDGVQKQISASPSGGKALTYHGPTGYDGGFYTKLGIYQWNGISANQSVIFDEFRQGDASSNLQSVTP